MEGIFAKTRGQKMNESLVKYLAGLLDADGSLSFNFKQDPRREGRWFVRLRLALGQSGAVDTTGFIETLPDICGIGAVHTDRNSIIWTVSKRSDLEKLLPRVIKHMVIKAKHWQYLLKVWRLWSRGYGENTVSTEQMAAIKEASQESRIENVGPVKPKNHPTWAWLAGYLDGDGWYRYKFQPKQNYWQINVGAVCHNNDIFVLEFLQRAFGGHIYPHSRNNSVSVWRRNLGANDASFALRFLPNLTKHSRLKRHRIDQMIQHHQQRLSVQGASA